MSSEDIAISVRNLTKTYRIFGHPGDRIKQAATFGLRKYHREFTAIKDVSFDIKKGETVGIIGRNGSGKSTLLQLICGILKPTSGTVQVTGRVSALLELGAGFNPEFTGRENVYFQGALMGFTKTEMDARFGEIAAFADIGEFIDQPVRTYSSGMFVRLAFAVAVHLDNENIVIDEALSVGDFSFQQKAIGRIRRLQNEETTILFVSHDNSAVQSICDRAILVDAGELRIQGKPEAVVNYYNTLQFNRAENATSHDAVHDAELGTASTHRDAAIQAVSLLNARQESVCVITVGTRVTLVIAAKIINIIPRLVVGYMIKDRFGQPVFGTNSHRMGHCLERPRQGSTIEYRFTFDANLGPGSYSVAVALHDTPLYPNNRYEWRDAALVFSVINTQVDGFVGVAWLPPNLECR